MRARRTDANLKAVVEGLRAWAGVSVLVLNAEVDLAVGYEGRTYLFEVKNPKDRRPSARGRSQVQKKLKATWTGHYDVIETVEEAVEIMLGPACWEPGDRI